MQKRIKKILEENEFLISALQVIQDEYGFISEEIVEEIEKHTDYSASFVYSVASFYSGFRFKKSGKYRISVCTGTVCYVKGADKIVEEIGNVLKIKDGEITKDELFSLDTARCIGCCSLAPVMLVNDDVYGNIKVTDVRKILEKYKGDV